MFLVVWWDADENDDKFVPFASKKAAEEYYAELVANGAWVYLCKVLKEKTA
jgi:hypothetical protein